MTKYRHHHKEEDTQLETKSTLYSFPKSNSDSDLSDSDINSSNHCSKNDASHQDRTTTLLKTKATIRRLSTVMHISNILILTFASSVIVLYYTTSLFDGFKRQQKMKQCTKATEDFTSFEECYNICYNDIHSDGCRPLHNLLNPEMEEHPLKGTGGTTAVLETLCSSESLSSEEGQAKCRTKCRISECCWSIDSETNCLDVYGDMCGVFQPCMSYYVGVGTFGMGVGPVIITDSKKNDRDP